MPVTRDPLLPSFSVIYETENLSSVELDNVYRSLDSLIAQDIPVSFANEFLIMQSGDLPEDVLRGLCAKYPWITVKRIEAGVGYYGSKMKGVAAATAETVLFCDSDCVYDPGWMRQVLTFFKENPSEPVLAGETSTAVRNPYELAIAMSYFFPRFTRKEKPYESSHYFCNNVAFRRQFLLEHPILPELPLFRGNCLVHAHTLRYVEGYKIWKHPKARALHEPPQTSFSFWRLLLLGHDRVIRNRLIRRMDSRKNLDKESWLFRLLRAFQLPQIYSVLKEDPKRILMFPVAIFISLWLGLLFNLGRIVTYFSPDILLKRYERMEGKA